MPPEAVAAEIEYVRAALPAMGPDDRAAVVLFGADALVERPMLAGSGLQEIASRPITTQTDLAGAIRLGLALFPAGSARRMVILSDGAETSGDAFQAAGFAEALGVQIVTVPYVVRPAAEALLEAVDGPTGLRPGERFDLNVSIRASEPMQATLRILAGDRVVYEQAHPLHRGLQTLSLPLEAGVPGFVRYQVQIAPERDTYYQNNRLDAFSVVEGPPRILVVAPQPGEVLPGGEIRPDEHSALMQVLQAAGYAVNLVTPGRLPRDLAALAQYNSVVLVDVPARMLGSNQMTALQAYVRDLGGGLVAVGGPTSYAVGGYYATPLEEMLPVEMQIRDEQRRPSLAMVFVIDRSGSMSELSGGVEKIELAKAAVARSAELLFSADHIGVVAFDDTARWVVPMTDLTDLDSVVGAVGTIRSGGGTDILAGLQAVAEVLPGDPAKVKHVILLTDGGADPAGIPELVERLYQQEGITLSTVGVGRDAAPFLDDLAVLGGGRYHAATEPASIPTIFTEETTLASRGYIMEEPFFPTSVSPSPILAGIQGLPQLQGYVASSPKGLAQVILESDRRDPILAAWQYGLGRSVAFTSDATGRWAREWIVWQGFPAFWLQTIRYTLGEAQEAAVEASIRLQGGQAQVLLEAMSQNGEFLNGYSIEANVISPDGEATAVTLGQVAPGRYEGFFQPAEQGVYLVRITGRGQEAGAAGFNRTVGWTMSYSPEYRLLESDPDLLARLALLTGGKVASSDPAEAFAHDLRAVRASRPIWPWLLALAAVLLPMDVAARRLVVTRQDLRRLRAALVGLLPASKQAAEDAAQPSERMQALLHARDRARAQTPAPSQSRDSSGIIQRPSAGQPPAPAPEAPAPAAPPSATSAPEEGASTTQILLRRKKKR
jgi:Mg-chelatase subunit ChlD